MHIAIILFLVFCGQANSKFAIVKRNKPISLAFANDFSGNDYHFKKQAQEWEKCLLKLALIKNWAIQENKYNIQPALVLYPFGGPDVLYPLTFFPKCTHLVLIGLEKIGEKFDITDPKSLEYNLAHLLVRGYFVTKRMQEIKQGILTIILIQLKKLGAKNITYIVFEKELRISCTINNIKRTITYIQMNLHNDNVKNWENLFGSKKGQYKSFALFIKSASFVMQQFGFDKIKTTLLQRASYIIQDDTGIAYNLLTTNFTITLYGTYQDRCDIYGLRAYFQHDLKKIYEDNIESISPLIFSITYRRFKPNLMIAIRHNEEQS